MLLGRSSAIRKQPYFGVEINDRSLTLGEGARIAATHFDDWLNTSAQK
jgi:hypothetical protein